MNSRPSTATDTPLWMPKVELQSLVTLLRSQGYIVVAPTVQQDAIVYDEIDSVDQLPIGLRESQQPGAYRLRETGNDAYFEFNMGPHSWKQFLFPPRVTVQVADREADGWRFKSPEEPAPRYAMLGVRACELAAIRIQDKVFLEGPYVDPDYRSRRESTLLIAVNCTVAASTCFCTSMDTGPRCESGFDLAMTEIDGGFVVETGSQAGAEITGQLNLSPGDAEAVEEAGKSRQRAVTQIEKKMDTTDLRDLLLNNLEHPRWDEVAERCLSCTNCTMVCPTCFCSTVSEVSDLVGDHVDRLREWDSCFNADFSYTTGGPVRNNIRSRYRQWLTHKLASWHDQFDSSGCVGCGRCITWCPVGIDLTEEVAAIRSQPSTHRTVPVVAQPPVECEVPAHETSASDDDE